MKTLQTAVAAIAVVASILFCGNVATATSTIVVGDHDLLPNAPDQIINILVAGDDMVQGLNFNIQVADGGTHAKVGGSIEGPHIQSVDLLTGTIFDGNNTGQVETLELPQVAAHTVTTSTGAVAANGLLARVTVDTSGFTDGSFGLYLRDTRNGPTDFAGVPIQITDGSINIVPEPMALGAALIGMLATGARLRRRRRGA